MKTSNFYVRWLQVYSLLLSVCLVSSNSWADETLASLASPNQLLRVAVQRAGDGRLSYTVMRRGKILIAPSRLGFLLTNAPQLDAGFQLEKQSVSEHDDTWEQAWGERRFVRNHYKELRLDVVQKPPFDRHLTIVFRVFDDGVGFRYEFPDQAQLHEVKISDELTEFVVAPDRKSVV